MADTITALSSDRDSRKAGLELGRRIREAFEGAPADAVVVFASAQHDYDLLLNALAEEAGTSVIVGSSSAGEFTNSGRGEGRVSALGLRSKQMKFSVARGSNISRDPIGAARELASGLLGSNQHAMPFRSALVMTDALAGHTDAIIEELTVATGGSYRFFGGGAGDDARFQKTHVFAGTEAISDAIVALEILSMKPVGIGVSHGWEPDSPPLRVTEADGNRLISLNGEPAVQAFEDHAARTGQRLDPAGPLPFFLHNILGIETGGQHRLRVPLGIEDDGSVTMAAAVSTGSIVRVMKTSEASAVRAAQRATQTAIDALGGERPAAALIFDCVATRLRLGRGFENELQACTDLLQPAAFVGCNTYGQIARADGQFGGFHNCTAVVMILPA